MASYFAKTAITEMARFSCKTCGEEMLVLSGGPDPYGSLIKKHEGHDFSLDEIKVHGEGAGHGDH